MRKKKWLSLMYVFIGIIGIGSFSLIYTQIVEKESLAEAQKEKSVIYPTQYSDTRITKNAIETDQRFKDLAVLKKESFLASVISSLQTNRPTTEVLQPEKGTWLWTPILDMTPSYWNSIIASAKKNDIRNIYLSIDSYLDIFVMPDGPEKDKKKKAFDNIIESFITTAHKNNMTVDAEAGWRNWAEPGNEYKASAIIDYVLQFNETHAEKLRGFQYDIEPYLLSSYATEKKKVLRNFIDLVNETITRLNNSNLAFSVVIPDFYDGASGEIPRFFYGWSYSYTLNHLLKVLERRPGSTIIVMAYRNFSEGTDGSIDISQEEIKSADEYNTKVIVAQETGDVLPPYVTFYNTSLSRLNTQIQSIEKEFTNHKSYNGIAIHYINALIALE
ncbi:MAG: hypothetical protein V1711_00065 [bacterium]